ncbi:MAG: DUF3450 domain-containing protein [Helicobacteraceae bacterium]|jgi:hypothetical protein|nr:DUF3450 domain-containing protein [Helicobacteraceae bacterium]
MRIAIIVVWLITVFCFGGDLDTVLSEASAGIESAAVIQSRIDALDDESKALYEEYRVLARQIEMQERYNAELEGLIVSQNAETESLKRQIATIDETMRSVLPLIRRMIDSFEAFVSYDLPFLPAERIERVERLKNMFTRADSSIAEKYRVVLEAYAIENEYSRTIEAYAGELEDGRAVDFLRVGRIGLYYLTRDHKEGARYDMDKKVFLPLKSSERETLLDAIKIARKERVVDLIALPLSAPKVKE